MLMLACWCGVRGVIRRQGRAQGSPQIRKIIPWAVGIGGPGIGCVPEARQPDQRLVVTDWPEPLYPFSTSSREYDINFASPRTWARFEP